MSEPLSTYVAPEDPPATKNSGNPISADSYIQMSNFLNSLLSHTHIFYDNYGSACNCNCDCNCTRGTL